MSSSHLYISIDNFLSPVRLSIMAHPSIFRETITCIGIMTELESSSIRTVHEPHHAEEGRPRQCGTDAKILSASVGSPESGSEQTLASNAFMQAIYNSPNIICTIHISSFHKQSHQ